MTQTAQITSLVRTPPTKQFNHPNLTHRNSAQKAPKRLTLKCSPCLAETSPTKICEY